MSTKTTEKAEKVECNRPHCDMGDCDPCAADHCDEHGDMTVATEALKRWHDEDSDHGGAFRFCGVAPCRPVREALEAADA